MDRGLTIERLAARSGVSASMVSAIERGTKAPTITVLDRLGRGLGVPVADLLADRSFPTLIVRRANDQDVVDENGWSRTILSPVVSGLGFEWIRTELPSGVDAGEFPAYATGSHEYIAVTDGQLELTVGSETVSLRAGDSVYFASDVVRRYRNTSDEACRYYVVAFNTRSRTPRHR